MTEFSGSDSNRDAGSGSDPFAHLHKMSTTAGLGSGEYVAVNAAAVVTLLLGAASATVLFNNLFFLIFPVAAIVAGVMAWNQISRSNGTQTGREVAVVGLLLALGFGGFSGVSTIFGAYRNRADEDQIVSQIHRLGELVKSESYVDAYAMFDANFHKRVSLNDFEGVWRSVTHGLMGQVKSLDWNKLLHFEIDPVDNSRIASGEMLLTGQAPVPARIHMIFRRSDDGSWLVDQIMELFPTEAQQQQQQKSVKPKGPQVLGPPKPE